MPRNVLQAGQTLSAPHLLYTVHQHCECTCMTNRKSVTSGAHSNIRIHTVYTCSSYDRWRYHIPQSQRGSNQTNIALNDMELYSLVDMLEVVMWRHYRATEDALVNESRHVFALH